MNFIELREHFLYNLADIGRPDAYKRLECAESVEELMSAVKSQFVQCCQYWRTDGLVRGLEDLFEEHDIYLNRTPDRTPPTRTAYVCFDTADWEKVSGRNIICVVTGSSKVRVEDGAMLYAFDRSFVSGYCARVYARDFVTVEADSCAIIAKDSVLAYAYHCAMSVHDTVLARINGGCNSYVRLFGKSMVLDLGVKTEIQAHDDTTIVSFGPNNAKLYDKAIYIRRSAPHQHIEIKGRSLGSVDFVDSTFEDELQDGLPF